MKKFFFFSFILLLSIVLVFLSKDGRESETASYSKLGAGGRVVWIQYALLDEIMRSAGSKKIQVYSNRVSVYASWSSKDFAIMRGYLTTNSMLIKQDCILKSCKNLWIFSTPFSSKQLEILVSTTSTSFWNSANLQVVLNCNIFLISTILLFLFLSRFNLLKNKWF